MVMCTLRISFVYTFVRARLGVLEKHVGTSATFMPTSMRSHVHKCYVFLERGYVRISRHFHGYATYNGH